MLLLNDRLVRRVIQVPQTRDFDVHHYLVLQELDVGEEDRFVLDFREVLDFALVLARVGLLLARLLLRLLIPLFCRWRALFHLTFFRFLRFGFLLWILVHDFADLDEFAQRCEHQASHVCVESSVVALASILLEE